MKQLKTKNDIMVVTKNDNFFLAPEGLPKIIYFLMSWKIDRQQKKIKK